MTRRSLSLGHPGERGHGVYPPRAAGPGPASSGPEELSRDTVRFQRVLVRYDQDHRDAYPLILILAVLAVFVHTILAFGEPGAPLFIIIVMAFWRLFPRGERGDR
jgi:hypothetical protein